MSDPDCIETLRELELYLDGEMSDTQLRSVRAHLEGCQQCFDGSPELRLTGASLVQKGGPFADWPAQGFVEDGFFGHGNSPEILNGAIPNATKWPAQHQVFLSFFLRA